MPRLSGIRLSVSNPAELANFYVDYLGMTATQDGEKWRVGYPGSDADLIFLPGGAPYSHSRSDDYWKIGITLPNVDIAHAQLNAAGIDVSTPNQFRDIGYMCHLSDPAGFQIELLQHDFAPNRPMSAGDARLPLGGGAVIGQVTLRSGENVTLPAPYADLGLRRLSVQPVRDLGFTLHFWAFTSDAPPNPDLEALENREWLWRRPYTTLEIQSVDGLNPRPNPAYGGLEVEGASDVLKSALTGQNRVYFT